MDSKEKISWYLTLTFWLTLVIMNLFWLQKKKNVHNDIPIIVFMVQEKIFAVIGIVLNVIDHIHSFIRGRPNQNSKRLTIGVIHDHGLDSRHFYNVCGLYCCNNLSITCFKSLVHWNRAFWVITVYCRPNLDLWLTS